MKFLVDKNIPLVREAFEPLGEVEAIGSTEFSGARVRDADVVIIRSETRVTRSLLEGSPIKFLATATIGVDHVDTEYLRQRGIGFASAPGCNANSVKEYLVAALLHLSKEAGWLLNGKTIGVVGVGNVGGRVVQAAQALGMTVLQNDPPLARRTGEDRFLPLGDLMGCDIITLHVPLTASGPDPTHHLFDKAGLGSMKDGAVLINTSRGGVVETEALKEALRSGKLSHAVLDVWEHEPSIDADLLALVACGTPHIAGYSLDGKVNAVRIIREEICRHFGITSPWDPVPLMGEASVTEIDVPADPLPPEDVLNRIVRRCYDITFDDDRLRRISGLPARERGQYFMGLRSGYRVRREFPTVTVHLPKALSSLRPILLALGFACDVK